MGRRDRVKRAAYKSVVRAERWTDGVRFARRAKSAPKHFRIDSFGGHGNVNEVVVRGRVLDNPPPSDAWDGESVWAAFRRTLGSFMTNEIPGAPLRIRIGTAEVDTTTDDEGYFEVRLQSPKGEFRGPWAEGDVGVSAPYRGLTEDQSTAIRARISDPSAAFGVISDVDDTILHTGAQRAAAMIRQTLTGSELTRIPFVGASELYQALAASTPDGGNPFFYVSSSPWNLHGFLLNFLRHRRFPSGPLLLRDLLGNEVRRTHGLHKNARIDEVLELHPDLSFILVGDSGQHDPEIYADVVERHPGRILAVYIREVRLDPGDRRVEAITDTWSHDVPFVLVPTSSALARHAATLGLIKPDDVTVVDLAASSGPTDLPSCQDSV